MIRQRFLSIAVMIVSLATVTVLVASCGGEAASPAPAEVPEPTAAAVTVAEPTTVPTEVPASTAAPTEVPAPTAAPTEPPPPTPVPTEPPPPTPAPAEEFESAGGPTKLDMDAIFPPGRGRELSIMGCTGCHNFVPLVILQLTEEEWDRNARDHRDRCSAMIDEDYEILYDYLKENFGPDDPVPELPQELLDQWTSY